MSDDVLMTPAEVAKVFRVNPKTVARWAAAGRLAFIRTPGGHRRYLRSDVDARIAEERAALVASLTSALIEDRLKVGHYAKLIAVDSGSPCDPTTDSCAGGRG